MTFRGTNSNVCFCTSVCDYIKETQSTEKPKIWGRALKSAVKDFYVKAQYAQRKCEFSFFCANWEQD